MAGPRAQHVLLIVADDMNPYDVGALRRFSPLPLRARPYVATPHLDRLAASGVVVAHAYSPHTICTPARAALLTGRLQSTNARVISTANRQGLEPSVDFSATLSSEPTIATQLSAAGSFVCGSFGKWHLHTWTDPRDQARCSAGWSNFSAAVLAQVRAGILGAGFHEAKTVSPCNRASNAAHDLDAIVESAQAFISRTLAAPLLYGGRRRFFAYVALTLMHEPLAWLHLRDRSRKRINPALDEALMRPNLTRYERHYVTGIAWVDASIGALLDTLHRLRVAQTTLTIFTADHGRDGKYTCTAAGMRVPWIASWPQALPAGSVLTDELVSHIDLLPTILAATSTPAAVGVSELKGSNAYTEGHERADGRSVLPALMRTKYEIEQQERQRYERRRERAYVLCETYRDRAILSQTHHIVWRSPDATRTGWGAASSAAAGIPRDGRDAWMPGSWRDAVQLYNHSTARSGSSPHRSRYTDDEGGRIDADPQQRHNLLAGRDAAQAEALLLAADPHVAWLWRRLRARRTSSLGHGGF